MREAKPLSPKGDNGFEVELNARNENKIWLIPILTVHNKEVPD
jgi:hypothetical protein